MSVEIDPGYLEEARRASLNKETGGVPETPAETPEAVETPEMKLGGIEAEMEGLKKNRPFDMGFTPSADLFIKSTGLERQIKELEEHRSKIHRPESLTVFAAPGEHANKQQELYASLVAPIDRQIEDLQIEIALMKDAAKNLDESGQDDWADMHFSGQERLAAEELQAAKAEESVLEKAGLGDTKDIDDVESRVKALKEVKDKVRKSRGHLARAADQMRYLKLMKDRAQVMKKRPRA